MAKDNAAPAGNVVQMGTTACCVQKCTNKGDKMNFCKEHYMWFKEGLVNKKGEKPTDFDKKYQDFLTRKKAA